MADCKEVHTTATVEVTAGALIIRMEDVDWLWALNGQLDIPSARVIGAESAEAEARQWLHGLCLGGIHVPGVLSAGRFYEHGHPVFWAVHDMAPGTCGGSGRSAADRPAPGTQPMAVRRAVAHVEGRVI